MSNTSDTSNIPKLRVVFDTNVYISAILSSGNPRRVLEMASRNEIELLISDPIFSEIERVLRTKVFKSELQVTTTLSGIGDISILVSPGMKLSVIDRHEADNRIIECAVQGEAQYVVSGDHHVLSLKEYQGIKILSPTEFLEEINHAIPMQDSG